MAVPLLVGSRVTPQLLPVLRIGIRSQCSEIFLHVNLTIVSVLFLNLDLLFTDNQISYSERIPGYFLRLLFLKIHRAVPASGVLIRGLKRAHSRCPAYCGKLV